MKEKYLYEAKFSGCVGGFTLLLWCGTFVYWLSISVTEDPIQEILLSIAVFMIGCVLFVYLCIRDSYVWYTFDVEKVEMFGLFGKFAEIKWVDIKEIHKEDFLGGAMYKIQKIYILGDGCEEPKGERKSEYRKVKIPVCEKTTAILSKYWTEPITEKPVEKINRSVFR